MKLSETAQLIISLCWKDGETRTTNFVIGNTYEHEDKKHKATEELYEEILKYQMVADKPFKIYRVGKLVNLTGVKI